MAKKTTFSKEEAQEIEALIEQKLKATSDKQKGIRNKIRALGFYASDYDVSRGYTVADFKNVVSIGGSVPQPRVEKEEKTLKVKTIEEKKTRSQNDEAYIIDLCDEVLNQKASRQHKFDFLVGHTGRKLPVDAYYAESKLVVEYHERQHTEEVGFFNKRITSTGINRGEQRKQYDDLRRSEIPKNKLQLVIFDYSDFAHNGSKRLLRNRKDDLVMVKGRLGDVLKAVKN